MGVDSEFPDAVTATLSRGNASKQISTAINPAGTLMAVGCSDGAVAVYDYETRAVAKLLKGHTAPVVAVRSAARARRRKNFEIFMIERQRKEKRERESG